MVVRHLGSAILDFRCFRKLKFKATLKEEKAQNVQKKYQTNVYYPNK